MSLNLSNYVITKRIQPDGSGYTVAAGTTAVDSDIVDTAGADAVRFITGFGAIVANAVTSVKIQENSANSATGMADLAGTSITVADSDDNLITIAEIYRPRERYLRQVTSRATQNATIDFCIVELVYERKLPVTQDATVISAEIHNSPAEGTA